ncbi:MAG: NYN domain-containing protein [Rhizobiaceae bacterium]|nr:NYN domain-containing protein [Rhizobiaceae bacterium]
MRVYVYVDGFNLYYRALRHRPDVKWLNIRTLVESLLSEEDTVETIRYFTARVSPRAGDPDAPRRQQILFSALATVSGLHFHYGRFLPKQKWRPVVHPAWQPPVKVEVHDTEEKGSDVNLASHLLNDAHHDRFDTAFVVSQDTDLCEPIRMVKEMGKPVGVAWLDGQRPGQRMVKASSFVRQVTYQRLKAAQFPERVMARNGKIIERPDTWV